MGILWEMNLGKNGKNIRDFSQTDGGGRLENPLPGLCDKIEAFFRTGFEITREVSHQLCSMFGPDAENNPESLLDNPDGAEAATLFDFICFPDLKFQVSIEPLLVHSVLTPAQSMMLAEMVSAKARVTRLYIRTSGPETVQANTVKVSAGASPGPGPGKCFSAPVPPGVIDRFIRRLCLIRKMDPAVGHAISARFADVSGTPVWVGHTEAADAGLDPAMRCRVMLRNGRFAFTPETASFLCTLFENLETAGPSFMDALSVAIDFLDEAAASKSLQKDFARHRNHLCKMIAAAARADERVQKAPAEALMLSGTPVPGFDVQSVRRRLALTDRIGFAIYGNAYFRDIERDLMPLTVLEFPVEKE